MKPDEYFVLGIHDQDVETIEGNVARVRMIFDGKMIDEDFNLPRIITVEEQIDDMVKARMAEIKINGTDPALSNVIPAQPEQIVIEDKNESEQINV